ncbi:hypothetical protein QK694_s5gp1 [Emaravirus camelliae]|uniref:Uncharacterized protein n=1 Tax=Emaravirus camelliae TaxID=2843907 RepID=A0A6B9QQA1_9VIRU|nr:hypothetical protein QK694_s5gp1 [Emaravirus camelliae]QHG11077.1 hypothetical protein [Emaravirus camelliae]
MPYRRYKNCKDLSELKNCMVNKNQCLTIYLKEFFSILEAINYTIYCKCCETPESESITLLVESKMRNIKYINDCCNRSINFINPNLKKLNIALNTKDNENLILNIISMNELNWLKNLFEVNKNNLNQYHKLVLRLAEKFLSGFDKSINIYLYLILRDKINSTEFNRTINVDTIIREDIFNNLN